MLSLKSKLFSLAIFFRFFFENGLFGGVALMQLISFNLSSDEISLDTVDHVAILVLLHHLICALFGDLLHF
jgi:hypothetical protein